MKIKLTILALALMATAVFAGDNKTFINLPTAVYQENVTNWTMVSVNMSPVAYRTNVYVLKGIVTKATRIDTQVGGVTKTFEVNRETEFVYKTVVKVEPVSVVPGLK